MMLNVLDLHPGNVVSHREFGLVRIFGVSPDCIQYETTDAEDGVMYEEDVEPFSGIDITIDILRRSGFNSVGEAVWCYIEGKNQHAFFDFVDGALIFTGNEGKELSRPMVYVHEMQNIIHALYGVDLRIKPDLKKPEKIK